jgi:tRNA(fMet)-specific endonuclease VapC
MGLVLDSSILIADERGKFDMPEFLRQASGIQPIIAAITASELLHGVARATDHARKTQREKHVEQILSSVLIEPFGLTQARVHAQIWANLASRGEMIGSHDLLIAATAVAGSHDLATLNIQEFRRVKGLRVIDVAAFRRP